MSADHLTLPMPVDWTRQAACVGHNPDMWWPTPTSNPNHLVKALTICAACPVRHPCADEARTHGIDEGIWGGVQLHPDSRRTRGIPTDEQKTRKRESNSRRRAQRRAELAALRAAPPNQGSIVTDLRLALGGKA